MRYLATILIVLVTAPSWANERDSILQQAEALGAPMAAVRRAIEISHQPIFVKKDVLAVFDISKPSKKKRFYVLDFKSGQVTAHYAAHGRPQDQQWQFRYTRKKCSHATHYAWAKPLPRLAPAGLDRFRRQGHRSRG
jgi:hypothetical protein